MLARVLLGPTVPGCKEPDVLGLIEWQGPWVPADEIACFPGTRDACVPAREEPRGYSGMRHHAAW